MRATTETILDRARATLTRIDRERLEYRCKRLKATLRPWNPPVRKRPLLSRWLRRVDAQHRYRLAQLHFTLHLDLTLERFHPLGRLHRLEHERRRAWLHEAGDLPPQSFCFEVSMDTNELKLPWTVETEGVMGGAAKIVNSDDELVATVECAHEAPVIVDAIHSGSLHDGGIWKRQNEYLALQIAVIEKELERHAGPVRRNESAEHSKHGPQALEERERRSAAESRADLARTLLGRLPKVTSAVMHRAHNHDGIVQDMERRHAEQLRKATSHAEMESIRADSAQRNSHHLDAENRTLRTIVTGLSRHGIERIEAAINYLNQDDAA